MKKRRLLLHLVLYIMTLKSDPARVEATPTVTYSTESAADVLSRLLDSPICEQMPQLPSCKKLNPNGTGNPAAMNYSLEVGSDSPLLTMALDYIATTQQQNKELIEREREQVALVAKLEQEKDQLQGQVRALEEEWLPIVDRNRGRFGPRGKAIASPQSAPQGSPGSYQPTASILRPVDCSDHLLLGARRSGVYEIYPFRCRCSEPVKVWCDMETDGGGWTVILLRQNSSDHLNFSRPWREYRDGFGNASTEYWIGNENLHVMTNTRAYTLRLDFLEKDGTIRWAEWPKFFVDSEDNRYKLEVPQFDGRSMTDNCLSHHNGRYFSTYDYDSDGIASRNCAQDKQSGWWYNNCATLDPAIPFSSEGHLNTACTYKENGKNVVLQGPRLHMKIRPTICSQMVKAVYFNTHTCEGHNGL